jgi:hypothetical protein
MSAAAQWGRPAAATEANGQTAESLLDQVLRATEARRFSIDQIHQMAATTAKAGMFRMTESQIEVLMLVAEARGIHPAEAAMRFYITKDQRIGTYAGTMAAEFQKAGGVIRWSITSNEVAEASFHHPVTCPDGLLVRYTIEDAKLAGLLHKDNWKQEPSDMLVARCIARGVRRVLPGSVLGMYEADEIPAAPAAPEQSARQKLVERLTARKEASKPIEVTARAAEPLVTPEPAKAPNGEPATEWGKWISAEVGELNDEVFKLANANPTLAELRDSKGRPKVIATQQVVNHVVKLALGSKNEEEIETDGKRDKAKVVAFMTDMWANDPLWVQDEVRGYLADLMGKLTAEPAAAGA